MLPNVVHRVNHCHRKGSKAVPTIPYWAFRKKRATRINKTTTQDQWKNLPSIKAHVCLNPGSRIFPRRLCHYLQQYWYFFCFFIGIAVYVIKLRFRQMLVPGRNFIKCQPAGKPYKTNDARKNKCPLPAHLLRNYKRYRKRCKYGPDVCTGIKNTGCQCPLFFGKPFRHSFNRRRKVGRFCDTLMRSGQR